MPRPRRPEDRWTLKDGTVVVRVGDATIQEHRLVMMAMLGRPLLRGEQVRHTNRDRSDNRPENLEIQIGTSRGTPATAISCPHCGEPWQGEVAHQLAMPVSDAAAMLASGAWPISSVSRSELAGYLDRSGNSEPTAEGESGQGDESATSQREGSA